VGDAVGVGGTGVGVGVAVRVGVSVAVSVGVGVAVGVGVSVAAGVGVGVVTAACTMLVLLLVGVGVALCATPSASPIASTISATAPRYTMAARSLPYTAAPAPCSRVRASEAIERAGPQQPTHTPRYHCVVKIRLRLGLRGG
jgi:hypothetical protein